MGDENASARGRSLVERGNKARGGRRTYERQSSSTRGRSCPRTPSGNATTPEQTVSSTRALPVLSQEPAARAVYQSARSLTKENGRGQRKRRPSRSRNPPNDVQKNNPFHNFVSSLSSSNSSPRATRNCFRLSTALSRTALSVLVPRSATNRSYGQYRQAGTHPKTRSTSPSGALERRPAFLPCLSLVSTALRCGVGRA